MVSVTKRISETKQPRGGYLPPKKLQIAEMDDGIQLHAEENIHPSLAGLAVDYLARISLGTPAEEAFKISLMGAWNVKELDVAVELVRGVKGLDDQSIEHACKLAGFDVAYRHSVGAYSAVEAIQPDTLTISNIRTMAKRAAAFFEKIGPVTKDGFTFEGGYSRLITSGDGDFLTGTGLWDLKVSKSGPTSKHTLQVLVYYLLGLRSVHSEFKNIHKLGIMNPRLNKAYVIPVQDIPLDVIEEVNTHVIGS